jgi:2,3-dihydroxy-p-cumate/2,3-dihydroxybenzoate 3,4-dioxygenase
VIRHMVLFTFKPDTDEKSKATVLDGLAELPRHFPQMRQFGLGENFSQRDQTFSHVMTMEFETREQLETYLKSERHEEFVTNVFRPNIERRAIASYESRHVKRSVVY